MKVFKFGGGILKEAASIRMLHQILQFYSGDNLVIVLSAFNKTTNNLEKLISEYFYDKNLFYASFDKLRSYHHHIVSNLGFGEDSKLAHEVNRLFEDLTVSFENYRSYPYNVLYDQVVSFGELLSCHIISEYLKSVGLENTFVDARKVIKTNNRYRNAEVDYLKTDYEVKKMLGLEKNIYIIQGFIGSSPEGLTTTLGREGSDYSAAVIANLCQAEEAVFWKDVPGIFNADPKYYAKASLIRELCYDDARNLTGLGAKVLHYKTIKPLEEKNIPLYLNLFAFPVSRGTVIYDEAAKINDQSVIVHRFNKILMSIKSANASELTEKDIQKIESLIENQHLEINYKNKVAGVFFVSLNHLVEPIIALRDELKRLFKVEIHFGVCMLKIQNAGEDVFDEVLQGVELIHRDRISDVSYLFY